MIKKIWIDFFFGTHKQKINPVIYIFLPLVNRSLSNVYRTIDVTKKNVSNF